MIVPCLAEPGLLVRLVDSIPLLPPIGRHRSISHVDACFCSMTVIFNALITILLSVKFAQTFLQSGKTLQKLSEYINIKCASMKETQKMESRSSFQSSFYIYKKPKSSMRGNKVFL